MKASVLSAIVLTTSANKGQQMEHDVYQNELWTESEPSKMFMRLLFHTIES